MLHKHDPVSEAIMGHKSPNNSICQVLRDIYWKTDDPDIRLWCREATAMAKAMSRRIAEIQGHGFAMEGFWEKNKGRVKY